MEKLLGDEEAIAVKGDELEMAKQPVVVALPINEALVKRIDLQDDDVVMHYKQEMNCTKYIPAYPEGVKWLLQLPGDEPGICPHSAKEWTMENIVTNLTKPPQSQRDLTCKEIVGFVADWEKNGLTEVEKADWESWLEDVQNAAEAYIEETPWSFPRCRSTFDAAYYEMQGEDESKEEGEFLVHAGYEAKEARAKGKRSREAKRIEAEADVATDYEPISVGDFLMYWEEVVEDSALDAGVLEEYRGMKRVELQCPLVLGVAVEDCDVKEPGHTVKVERWRQPDGDMNKGFHKALLRSTNKVWIVDISRDSVLLVSPALLSGRPVKLQHKTKKALCELEKVGGVFHLVAGQGMVRK